MLYETTANILAAFFSICEGAFQLNIENKYFVSVINVSKIYEKTFAYERNS